MQRKTLLKLLSSVAATTVLIVSTGAHAENQVVKVGTIAGPDEQTWAVVQKVARSEGLDVKIVTFNDYVQPNAALDAGDLDANSFQHQPYLDSQVKQRGYKIVTAGLTYISPIGIYSKKLKSVKDIQPGAKLALPNDPSLERKPCIAVTAGARARQTEAGRRHRRQQRDPARYCRQSEEAQADRA